MKYKCALLFPFINYFTLSFYTCNKLIFEVSSGKVIEYWVYWSNVLPLLGVESSLLIPVPSTQYSLAVSFADGDADFSDSLWQRANGPSVRSKGKTFACPDCSKLYNHASSYNRHRKFECGKEPAFPCLQCSYRGKRKSRLDEHIKNVHSEPKRGRPSRANRFAF